MSRRIDAGPSALSHRWPVCWRPVFWCGRAATRLSAPRPPTSGDAWAPAAVPHEQRRQRQPRRLHRCDLDAASSTRPTSKPGATASAVHHGGEQRHPRGHAQALPRRHRRHEHTSLGLQPVRRVTVVDADPVPRPTVAVGTAPAHHPRPAAPRSTRRPRSPRLPTSTTASDRHADRDRGRGRVAYRHHLDARSTGTNRERQRTARLARDRPT